jgi:ubiquinone/menaquinone biosynthesis C-methylase UbiE
VGLGGEAAVNKERLRAIARTAARNGVPLALIGAMARPGASRLQRVAAAFALVGLWTVVYARYRKGNKAKTAEERELLKRVSWEAFWRHYNERVPTIEEEFDLWGPYHQHRHEMRYDLVGAAVRDHLLEGGRVLDVGCGSGLVADRILDKDATYIGFDFGGHHIEYAHKRFSDIRSPLKTVFARGDGQKIPFADASVDVVVLSEVIEHLLQPELAVWEIARVLKPGGVFVMTTNNASEVPLRSPLSHLFAWLEKAAGADHPSLISLRPWVWPYPVDRDLLPEGSPDVYLPHTHHIQAETRAMFGAAGMDTFHWSTFEFPPPQAALAQWLDKRGALGRQIVDVIEWGAQHTPIVRRLGCHVFMLSRKTGDPIAPEPPPGVWPGPFSVGAE